VFVGLRGGQEYTVQLIEGYDIAYMRELYKNVAEEESIAHVKRRLMISETGELYMEQDAMTEAEITAAVEDCIVDVCLHHGLIREGEVVCIGLSGGVDSSSLLVALDAVRIRLPHFVLQAVTFEDLGSAQSRAFRNALALAKKLQVPHQVVHPRTAQEIFHLKMPVHEVLPYLMNTPYAHLAMYIDHHTTRRVLEIVSERTGANKIALGLHATDLVAGLLNSYATGYMSAGFPHRLIGTVEYIYPLAHVTKQELHLYHKAKTGILARHTSPSEWELYPKDRNFYYFLADILQAWWPGVDLWLLSSHEWRVRRSPPLRFSSCQNCGASVLEQPFEQVKRPLCDACQVFFDLDLIQRKAGA
jgi:tRNA(Ile)-lysidine synthase TilS/MesJ